MGSLAADGELDALKDAAEGEILGMHNLLARYAPLLAALCHNRCRSPAACFLLLESTVAKGMSPGDCSKSAGALHLVSTC